LKLNNYADFRSQQAFFESSDGALAFLDKGAGPVLVLLHGVPSSGWLYRHMIPQLVISGYRVIVPDMLGFGASDSPDGYDVYSEESHARRLIELMDHLKIDSWHHLMHDAGGLWTWPLFKFAPARILTLTALNCIAFQAGFKPPMRFSKGFIAKTVMWLYRNSLTNKMMIKGLFKSGLQKNNLSEQDIKGYKQPLLEGKTKAMYYFFTQTCNALPSILQYTDKVKVPAQVIWGQHDSFLKLAPQRTKFMAFLGITDENVHLLDAKHFIQEEDPEKIVRLITAFIA